MGWDHGERRRGFAAGPPGRLVVLAGGAGQLGPGQPGSPGRVKPPPAPASASTARARPAAPPQFTLRKAPTRGTKTQRARPRPIRLTRPTQGARKATAASAKQRKAAR
jgi:hypothetical protein